MARYILLFLIFTLTVGCGNADTSDGALQEKPTEFKTKVQFKSFVFITSDIEKEVEKWESYRSLNRFMNRFTNATPEEILSNALELRDLVKSAKFSKNIPEIFDVPPIRARFNILYNQTLRLADMTFIPAITADAVIQENEKILLSFSSINSRFISILSKKRFEDEIEIDMNAIGLDSTKMDSISKKTISRNLEEIILEKELQNRKNKKGKN